MVFRLKCLRVQAAVARLNMVDEMSSMALSISSEDLSSKLFHLERRGGRWVPRRLLY